MEELNYSRKALLSSLSIIIGESIAENIVLEWPQMANLNVENKRPELSLFDLQMGSLDLQKNLVKNKLTPRLGLMGQIGYGRPALNMLNNDFKEYYIGGLKLSWSISSFYTNTRERKLLDGQKAMIVAQREVFQQQTQIGSAQVQREIEKWDALLRTDGQLLETRKRILSAADMQFKQGTISSLDYLAYLNQLEQANQQMHLHQIQKLQSVYQQQFLLGN